METNHTASENLNDLIFENRNKAYGAYAIRNSYNDNVSIALLIALLLSASLSFVTFLFSKNDKISSFAQGQVIVPEVFIMPVDLTPPAKPETKIEKIEPPKDITPKSDNLVLVASDDKKNVIETTNANAVITKDGKPDGTDSAVVEPTEYQGTMTVAATSNEAKIVADEMPEFNGNLFQFIKSKIHYPHIARDNGTSGTVVLQFTVEKDGSIDNINVLKSVGDGCTEEAIRVVKAMPKWKPGKNGGQPVRVLFNLPVKFTIK